MLGPFSYIMSDRITYNIAGDQFSSENFLHDRISHDMATHCDISLQTCDDIGSLLLLDNCRMVSVVRETVKTKEVLQPTKAFKRRMATMTPKSTQSPKPTASKAATSMTIACG